MMSTSIARTFLMRDRLDWNRPRLNWMSRALYSARHRRRHDAQ